MQSRFYASNSISRKMQQKNEMTKLQKLKQEVADVDKQCDYYKTGIMRLINQMESTNNQLQSEVQRHIILVQQLRCSYS